MSDLSRDNIIFALKSQYHGIYDNYWSSDQRTAQNAEDNATDTRRTFGRGDQYAHEDRAGRSESHARRAREDPRHVGIEVDSRN